VSHTEKLLWKVSYDACICQIDDVAVPLINLNLKRVHTAIYCI